MSNSRCLQLLWAGKTGLLGILVVEGGYDSVFLSHCMKNSRKNLESKSSTSQLKMQVIGFCCTTAVIMRVGVPGAEIKFNRWVQHQLLDEILKITAVDMYPHLVSYWLVQLVQLLNLNLWFSLLPVYYNYEEQLSSTFWICSAQLQCPRSPAEFLTKYCSHFSIACCLSTEKLSCFIFLFCVQKREFERVVFCCLYCLSYWENKFL